MNYDFDFESLENVIKVTRKKHNNIFIPNDPASYSIKISFKNKFMISLMWGSRIFGDEKNPNEIALIKGDDIKTFLLNPHPECKIIINYLNDQQVLDYIKKAGELK